MTEDPTMEIECRRCGSVFDYFEQGQTAFVNPVSTYQAYEHGVDAAGTLDKLPGGYLCPSCTESYQEWFADTSAYAPNNE